MGEKGKSLTIVRTVGIAVKTKRRRERRARPMFLFHGCRLELQRAKMMKGDVKKNCMSLAIYLDKTEIYSKFAKPLIQIAGADIS